MLKLSENKVSLVNLGVTIAALDNLNFIIHYYSQDKPGPAYVSFEGSTGGVYKAQIDRNIMVKALEEQRESLYSYLEGLGIDARN